MNRGEAKRRLLSFNYGRLTQTGVRNMKWFSVSMLRTHGVRFSGVSQT
jgi:hypothetical protein